MWQVAILIFQVRRTAMGLSSSATPSIYRTSIAEGDSHQHAYAETPIIGSPAAATRSQRHGRQSSTCDEGQSIASPHTNASNSMISNHIEAPHYEFLDIVDTHSIAGSSQPRRPRYTMQLIEGMSLDHAGPIEATLEFENRSSYGYPSSLSLTESGLAANYLHATSFTDPRTSNDVGAASTEFWSMPVLYGPAPSPASIRPNDNAPLLADPRTESTRTHNAMHTASVGGWSALSKISEQSAWDFSGNGLSRLAYTFPGMVDHPLQNVDDMS